MKKIKLSKIATKEIVGVNSKLLSIENGNALSLSIQDIAELLRIGATPIYTNTNTYDREASFTTLTFSSIIPSGSKILLSIDIEPIRVVSSRFTIAFSSTGGGRINIIYFNPYKKKRYFFECVLDGDVTGVYLYPQLDNASLGSGKDGHGIFSNITII